MPAGVSVSKYIKFSLAAYLSMMAGAQVVHNIYRPLDSVPASAEPDAGQKSIT